MINPSISKRKKKALAITDICLAYSFLLSNISVILLKLKFY